jgi:DNA-binding NtrC family response regulator
MTPRALFFVGTPDSWEKTILAVLEKSWHVHMFDNAADVYKHIVHLIPDVIMFSFNMNDTSALKLFRQLRRLDRVCVLICRGHEIQAFVDKEYQHQRRLAKTPEGFRRLFQWAHHIRSDSFDDAHEVDSRPAVDLKQWQQRLKVHQSMGQQQHTTFTVGDIFTDISLVLSRYSRVFSKAS